MSDEIDIFCRASFDEVRRSHRAHVSRMLSPRLTASCFFRLPILGSLPAAERHTMRHSVRC